jgi:ABC-type branched-subunit amino acid transport system substrate-binding protein
MLAEEVIEKGGRDFRSQITRIAAQNPAVTVIYAYYAEGGLIVRQAAELGLKTQFISHGGQFRTGPSPRSPVRRLTDLSARRPAGTRPRPR